MRVRRLMNTVFGRRRLKERQPMICFVGDCLSILSLICIDDAPRADELLMHRPWVCCIDPAR